MPLSPLSHVKSPASLRLRAENVYEHMLTRDCLSATQDIVTGDELLSDSYNIKEVDGAVYEADCKKISIGNESFGRCSRDTLARGHVDTNCLYYRNECH